LVNEALKNESDIKTRRGTDRPRRREAVDLFLHQHQLSLEADCEMAIIAEYQRRIVGCGAIAGCVLKCIAVDPSLQGKGSA
jgi:[citrate (pro-3S)-lyase] ligase